MPTPVFNIPFPTAATKLRLLPTELESMALGLESALLAGGLPPATTASTVVAPTAAARDLQWGVPADATARRTLQDSGATTHRTDKGWAEHYFAGLTDGGPNPGGVPIPGWYPVSGAVPATKLNGASGALSSTMAAISFPTEQYDSHSLHSATVSPTRITIPVSGLYSLTGKVRTAPTGLTALSFAISGSQIPEAEQWGAQATGAFNDVMSTTEVVLTAGQYVELVARDTAGTAISTPQTWFSVRYLRPPVGA